MSKIEKLKQVKSLAGIIARAKDECERQKGLAEITELIDELIGTCPKCGNKNIGGKFCSECGHDLSKETIEPDSNESVYGAILSLDYAVVKELDGRQPIVLSIHEDLSAAVNGVKKALTGNVSCSLIERKQTRINIT